MTSVTPVQYEAADRLLAAHDADPEVASLRSSITAEWQRQETELRRAAYRAVAASWVRRHTSSGLPSKAVQR